MEIMHVTQAFFTFFRGVYFLLTGNTKASDLKGGQSFLSFVNECCKSYIFTVNVVTLSRSKMESPSRTIKSCFFQGLKISPQHIHYSIKSSHIFRKLGCLISGNQI